MGRSGLITESRAHGHKPTAERITPDLERQTKDPLATHFPKSNSALVLSWSFLALLDYSYIQIEPAGGLSWPLLAIAQRVSFALFYSIIPTTLHLILRFKARTSCRWCRQGSHDEALTIGFYRLLTTKSYRALTTPTSSMPPSSSVRFPISAHFCTYYTSTALGGNWRYWFSFHFSSSQLGLLSWSSMQSRHNWYTCLGYWTWRLLSS